MVPGGIAVRDSEWMVQPEQLCSTLTFGVGRTDASGSRKERSQAKNSWQSQSFSFLSLSFSYRPSDFSTLCPTRAAECFYVGKAGADSTHARSSECEKRAKRRALRSFSFSLFERSSVRPSVCSVLWSASERVEGTRHIDCRPNELQPFYLM